MAIYVQLIKWTDQGRKAIESLPDRVDAVTKKIEAMGVKVVGNYVTMGQYDQIAIADVPDEETMAKIAMLIAGRGNATTETLRCLTMDELRKVL